MAKFDKKKLAEACDGWQNVVCNQLCNENLPKNPEDWARLFETQAEKAIEENNKLLPAAFAKTLKKETEALEKMLTNSKQNPEIMKENIEKVPPITSYGECTHQQDFCDFRSDKGECQDVGAYQICKHNTEKTAQNTEERVNHPKHYQHPSGVECITVARHHDFNIGNALKYIWRAGIKQEQGISPTDKQIEDLQKAAFYIQDEIKMLKSKQQEQ